MLGTQRKIPEGIRLEGNLALLVSALAWLFVWCFAAHALVSSGVLWGVFGEVLGRLPERRLEATFFAHADVPVEGVVVIGDSAFVTQIERRLPAGTPTTALVHQWMDLDSAARLLAHAASSSPRLVLIQNLPFFWSDMWSDFWSKSESIAGTSTTPLWDAAQGKRVRSRNLLYLGQIRALLEEIKLWASTGDRESPASGPQRPTTLFAVEFIAPEERLEVIHGMAQKYRAYFPPWLEFLPFSDPSVVVITYDPIPKHFFRRVYWVGDLSGLPEDTPAALIEGFEAYFRSGRTHPELGHFTSFEDLPGVMPRMTG